VDVSDFSDLKVMCVQRDGTRIAEFPNAQVERMSWVLNDVGEARIALPANDPKINAIQLAKNEIQIWHDGDIVWWGVPWRANGNHKSMYFDCDDLLSYFTKRFITYTSLTYEDLDQFLIAWNVVSHMQQGTYRSVNIVSGPFGTSGVPRFRDYKREEHENALDILYEFPGLDRGFDFGIRVFGDGRREMMFWHPKRGVNRNNMVMEWGKNIQGYTWNEDAVGIATEVYVTGGQANDIKFEENHRDDVAAANLGTHYTDIVGEGSQLDVEWLKDRAVEEVNSRKNPILIPEISVLNRPVQVFKTLGVGDTVPVKIKHGRANVDDMFRVTKIEWTPKDVLKLTLNEAA
jgi:hypothetical protein